MTRTESARLVGHNYRHLGVTFGKPWERIDRCGPGEYVGRHRMHYVSGGSWLKGAGSTFECYCGATVTTPDCLL